MLEVGTLKLLRVPDPAKVRLAVMNRIQGLVGKLIDNPSDDSLHEKLDAVVTKDVYGLTETERREIGAERQHA